MNFFAEDFKLPRFSCTYDRFIASFFFVIVMSHKKTWFSIYKRLFQIRLIYLICESFVMFLMHAPGSRFGICDKLKNHVKKPHFFFHPEWNHSILNEITLKRKKIVAKYLSPSNKCNKWIFNVYFTVWKHTAEPTVMIVTQK